MNKRSYENDDLTCHPVIRHQTPVGFPGFRQKSKAAYRLVWSCFEWDGWDENRVLLSRNGLSGALVAIWGRSGFSRGSTYSRVTPIISLSYTNIVS